MLYELELLSIIVMVVHIG